jgi:peptide-methionine (S)-S-oxide reductase
VSGGARRTQSSALRIVLLGLALLGSAGSATSGASLREKATFAGGCFWCMEGPFDKLKGVASTTSGFSGGRVANPTYEQVARGGTGHAEAVQVVFDPAKVSYEQLLDVFWKNIDPLDAGGQFCDRGDQYRSAIFYEGDAQKEAALASRDRLLKSGRLKGRIVTEIVPLEAFYPAEEYHQDYYMRNMQKYWSYRNGCGRDKRLRELWGQSEH